MLQLEEKIQYIGNQYRLKLSDCKKIAFNQYQLQIDEETYSIMNKSFHFLQEKINKRELVYGINTQFGDQVNIVDSQIKNQDEVYLNSIINRQYHLIRSHSCGLGQIVPTETVRLAMALRAHCLAKGYSGVSPDVIKTIISFINHDIVPVVRQYGSIGASGDLIPLSTIASAYIGEDTDVIYKNKIMPARIAIQKAGLKAFKPIIREGLALANGTSFMTAIAGLAVNRMQHLFKQMLTTIALALESMLIIKSAYHPVVHQLKNHSGEIEVNQYILNCWEGSQLLTELSELSKNNKPINKALQDCYSLRSVAQGFGPFHENLRQATQWIENEMNSVNDNPIVDVENQAVHQGANFMGYYITDACDILKMNIAQASTWLHALLANMVHPRKNFGLPTSLVLNSEKFNGFRPLQLLTASLAVQNRKLAQSHQAYMLPTEGDNQDVNSLGTHAAFDLDESVNNLERITGIILLASIQALEFRGIEKASIKAKNSVHIIRQLIPVIHECRPLTHELEEIILFLREQDL